MLFLCQVMENLQSTVSFDNRQALVGHLLEEARRQMLNYENERKKKVCHHLFCVLELKCI